MLVLLLTNNSSNPAQAETQKDQPKLKMAGLIFFYVISVEEMAARTSEFSLLSYAGYQRSQ